MRLCIYRGIQDLYQNEPLFVTYVLRESLVLLELLVHLDTRDLVACLVSVELLVPLESREIR